MHCCSNLTPHHYLEWGSSAQNIVWCYWGLQKYQGMMQLPDLLNLLFSTILVITLLYIVYCVYNLYGLLFPTLFFSDSWQLWFEYSTDAHHVMRFNVLPWSLWPKINWWTALAIDKKSPVSAFLNQWLRISLSTLYQCQKWSTRNSGESHSNQTLLLISEWFLLVVW